MLISLPGLLPASQGHDNPVHTRKSQGDAVVYGTCSMSRLAVERPVILELRYLQQQSYETIADQFGKTAHQIRALVHKALESLRKLLGADAENGADAESIAETENIEEA